jgi:hypothetical protein
MDGAVLGRADPLKLKHCVVRHAVILLTAHDREKHAQVCASADRQNREPSDRAKAGARSVAVSVPLMANYPSLLMRFRLVLNLVVLGAVMAMAHRVRAQSIDQVATIPPNVVLGNYDSVPVGPFGGLEAGAYVARVSDSSAAWFNPAGLSRVPNAQISASAGVYKWIAVAPEHLPHSGGSVQNLPNFVGGTFHLRGGINGGAVFLTTNSWLQEINSELVASVRNGQERLGYSADSLFVRRVAAVGAGASIGQGWRVGTGLSLSMTDLRLVQGISDRLVDSSGVRTLVVTARTAGSAAQLRAQAGVQYDAALLRFGAAIRTPGLTLRREGTITLDGVVDRGATSLGASLFDANAHFDDRLPWELQAGVALVAERAEAEVNVRAYTPVAPHSLMATNEPTRIYGDAGSGVPTVATHPFDGLTSASMELSILPSADTFDRFAAETFACTEDLPPTTRRPVPLIRCSMALTSHRGT